MERRNGWNDKRRESEEIGEEGVENRYRKERV